MVGVFPNASAANTQEVFLGLDLPNVPFTPGAAVYIDMNAFTGAYVNGYFSVPLAWDRLPLSLDVGVGSIVGYDIDGRNRSGLALMDVALAYAWQTDHVSLSPAIHLTSVGMEEINARRSEVWLGLGLSFRR